MITITARTLIIYFTLLVVLKLMGKRQVGELEISELVSTLILSEIVSIPIENADIPLVSALIPMLIIISLEITLSFACTKSDLLKRLLSGRPSVLISKGEIDIGELEHSRISVEELMSELRLQGISDPDDVYYAMLEPNGQLSVITKAAHSPITPNDTSIITAERGLSHAVIVDSHIKPDALNMIGKDAEWVNSYLSKNKRDISDIFLMTVNDIDEVGIVYKNKRKKRNKRQ